MDPNQLTQMLINAQSPDPNARSTAENFFREADAHNPALFLSLLSAELANEEKPVEARKLAGVILKNALTAKDEQRRHQLEEKWIGMDTQAKEKIKETLLKTLSSPVVEAHQTAAQVVSKIAHIEIPRNAWPQLIQHLLANMLQQDDNLKESTLQTLGYIAEEIDSEILQYQANEILTAVCQGIQHPKNSIKLAGLNALFNALEFIKANFDKEVERNYIMQVVCDSAVFLEDSKVRASAMECIVKISALYYDKLAPYMQKLFNITLEAIKKDEDQVAQQAVEFWSTVCDEEIILQEEAEEAAELKIQPERLSQNFIRGALKYLVPILTETLTKQEDEPDEDTWNVAMAAGTCLSLVALTVTEEIVPIVMPFVQQHINSENWKLREAATLAFGAILEGPKGAISQLITSAMPVLLTHMNDPVVYVKDTTAWTIGRVCQLHPHAIGGILPSVVQALLQHLQDSPRVAANVCWAIHNLALAYEDEQDKQTSGLSPFFPQLLETLTMTTDREDADENNLRTSAYESINVLIQNGAKDTYPIIHQALPVFISRFEKTFSMEVSSADDKEEQSELQSLLCGVLQVITQKIGESVKNYSDQLMTLLLQVFNAKSASVHEEAMMTVGAIANAVEIDFEKYMPHFLPFLTMGLRNYEEYQVCSVAVGVVGDIARALGPKISSYCDEIVSILLQNLQNPHLNRNVKPPILSAFGDIALAISSEFSKYLPVVMTVLQQASQTTVDQNDYDLVDYLNQLREGILESYTGIIQGLRSDDSSESFVPYANHAINFIGFVYNDPNKSESVTRSSLGVLGDMVHALGSKVKPQLQQQTWIKPLIDECLSSDNPTTQDLARWAKDIISKA